MSKQELKKALEAIGLALNATHNTVTTDISEIEPNETSWRVNHIYELGLLEEIEKAFFNTDTEMRLPEGCDFEPKTVAEAHLQQEMRKLLQEPKKYEYKDGVWVKNCPFCANSWGPPQPEKHKDGGRWAVGCMNAHCGASSGFCDSKEEAITLWNKRANVFG